MDAIPRAQGAAAPTSGPAAPTSGPAAPDSWLIPSPYDGSVAAVQEHAEAIAAMMRGQARLWLGPFAPPIAPHELPAGFEDTALVVPTSGSTGASKAVALSVAALTASQAATAETLGGDGMWLPLLPPTHIAGVQVIARAVRTALLRGDSDPLSAIAGPWPDLAAHFDAARFVELAGPALGAGQSAGLPVYTSLVPTQLARIIQDPSGDGARARRLLARFDAVLVGGAATSDALRVKARDAKLRLTYGSSETAGGCVYDGVPLRGVSLTVENSREPGAVVDDGEGRLLVTSPTLASGYVLADGGVSLDGFRDAPVESVRTQGSEDPQGKAPRTLVTSDLASLSSDGTLTVIGRADDVIITGGRKVVPQDVERLIEASLLLQEHVKEAVVVGVPDPEWGQRVEALAVPMPGVDPGEVHALVRSALRTVGAAPYQVPKRVHAVTALPLMGIGKIDRARAARIAAELDEREGASDDSYIVNSPADS